MKVTRVGDCYQLTFMPRMFPVSCYLVEEADSITLIDAALPSSAKSILNAIKQIGKPLERLVLTHGHSDHVGALDILKQQLPDVQVYISKRDARLLAGDTSMDPGEPGKINGGVPKNIKTRADVLISDGDEIGSLRTIATPGHTPGSMSFIDMRNHFLISGDAFQTRGGMAVSGQLQPLFPFPAMATWSKEEALESAKKLREIDPKYLAVGHGPLLMNPQTKMDLAIQKAEKRLVLS